MQTDEQIMQIFQDLREIYQTARQHNAETINQGEKQVLHYLCQTGGQAQPGEISRAITHFDRTCGGDCGQPCAQRADRARAARQ